MVTLNLRCGRCSGCDKRRRWDGANRAAAGRGDAGQELRPQWLQVAQKRRRSRSLGRDIPALRGTGPCPFTPPDRVIGCGSPSCAQAIDGARVRVERPLLHADAGEIGGDMAFAQSPHGGSSCPTSACPERMGWPAGMRQVLAIDPTCLLWLIQPAMAMCRWAGRGRCGPAHYDFIEKPLLRQSLFSVVERAIEKNAASCWRTPHPAQCAGRRRRSFPRGWLAAFPHSAFAGADLRCRRD